MKKRGQIGEAVKYIIIASLIILVTFIGYSTIVKINDRNCKVEIAKFELNLKNLDKVKYGSVKEFSEQIPCGADEIYFFDLSKDISLNFLNHIPLLKDSVQTKAQKNVFIVKDDEILSSFYAGSLRVGFPDYACLLPKFDKVGFFVEGKGAEVSFHTGCYQPECTYIPVEAEDEDALQILDHSKTLAGQSGKNLDTDSGMGAEFDNFYKAKANSKVFRKYKYCKEDGKTTVEIIIRPNEGVTMETFTFFESIPKDCIDDLRDYLPEAINGDVEITTTVDGSYDYLPDPLIMWTLGNLDEETRISYALNAILSDKCKEVIKGLEIAETVQEGRTDYASEKLEIDSAIIQKARDKNIVDEASCGNTDTDCGTYPYCNDCTLQNAFSGSKYCEASDAYNVYSDYLVNSCQSNSCQSNPNPESKIFEVCANGQECLSGACSCIAERSEACYDHDVYWFDSCDVKGSIKEDCGDPTPTSNYRCNENILERKYSNNNCDEGACTNAPVWEEEEDCSSTGKVCEDNECVVTATFKKFECKKEVDSGCVWNFDDECDNYDSEEEVGSCPPCPLGICLKDEYKCYNHHKTACSENPSCDAGDEIEETECDKCSDGTSVGQCSTISPLSYCDVNSDLIDDCNECGCSAGKVCQAGGDCI